MNQPTLKELCQEALTSTSGKKATAFAMKLRHHFHITEDEVRATEVDKGVVDDTALFAQQTVKVAFTRLRKTLWEHVISNNIVEVGKPLPRAGYWASGEVILVGVGKTFMFKTGRGSHVDPLKNPNFLALL